MSTPRWFPLYLGALVAALLSPLAWVRVPAPGLDWSFVPADLVGNILLFLPFGWALGHRLRWLAVLCGLLASGGAELAQMWLDRSPSLVDTCMNSVGTALGAQARRLLSPKVTPHHLNIRIARWPLLIGALGLHVWLALSLQGTPRQDFRDWQPQPLLIGTEEIGEVVWQGTLREFAFFDHALLPAELPRLRTAPWAEGGPVLYQRFAGQAWAGPGYRDGPAGRVPVSLDVAAEPGFQWSEAGLRLGPEPYILPGALADHLHTRLTSTHALSLYVEMVPSNQYAERTASILALANGWGFRSVSIAQQQDQLVFKVGTPHLNPEVDEVGAMAPTAPGPVGVLMTFDGQWERIYFDERLAIERYLGGKLRPLFLGTQFSLTFFCAIDPSERARQRAQRSAHPVIPIKWPGRP